MERRHLKMVKDVLVMGGKFEPSSPQATEFAQMGVPIACSVCGDEFDDENPDSVELFEVRVAPTVVGRNEPEGVWVVFYCKSCLNSLFGAYERGEPPPYIW